jgi:hypothetical protein
LSWLRDAAAARRQSPYWVEQRDAGAPPDANDVYRALRHMPIASAMMACSSNVFVLGATAAYAAHAVSNAAPGLCPDATAAACASLAARVAGESSLMSFIAAAYARSPPEDMAFAAMLQRVTVRL